MDLAFTKMHGIGNDFIVVEDFAAELDISPDAAAWICDRNFGIGADGLILIRPAASTDADFSWVFFNADGSQPEMCGNGIRCVARYVSEHGLLPAERDSVTIETLGGPRTVRIARDGDGRFESARVDMGEPILKAAEIPTTLGGDTAFDCPVETAAGTFRVTAISMGNPHAIIWVDDVDTAPLETVGPMIETHDAFPNRTNVEFVSVPVEGEDRIRVRVWERGVGETLACGTGACAALVAAVLACRTGREAVVELLGGELIVRWHADEHVYLAGPASEVFRGTLGIEDDMR